jgi:hypothetical protein
MPVAARWKCYGKRRPSVGGRGPDPQWKTSAAERGGRWPGGASPPTPFQSPTVPDASSHVLSNTPSTHALQGGRYRRHEEFGGLETITRRGAQGRGAPSWRGKRWAKFRIHSSARRHYPVIAHGLSSIFSDSDGFSGTDGQRALASGELTLARLPPRENGRFASTCAEPGRRDDVV